MKAFTFVFLVSVLVVISIFSAFGVYLHGKWNLADEAACACIVAVPWTIAFFATPNLPFARLFPGVSGLAATLAAICVAALFESWAWPEVVMVSGLALASVPVYLRNLS